MTQDEVIRIALEAGFQKEWIYKIPTLPNFLQRFAELAAADKRLK